MVSNVLLAFWREKINSTGTEYDFFGSVVIKSFWHIASQKAFTLQ
jgi:hypothetical protein